MSVVTVRSSGVRAEADFGAVKGIPQARGTARVLAPTVCQRSAFRVRVDATLARKVTLRADGRRRPAARKASDGRYAFGLHASRYAAGVHRLQVDVTFLDGTRKRLRAAFHRCAAARPQFTG
jgi:hypothetical protein